MRNLAIECSGLASSLGVFDGARPLAVRKHPSEVGSATVLAKMLADLMLETEWKSSRPSSTYQWISVTVGPGSFTGLRVGLTMAKMLGMAWKIPIAGVDTLQAIAQQQKITTTDAGTNRTNFVVPIINAFRQQVFSAVWEIDEQVQWHCIRQSHVLNADVWKENPCGLCSEHRIIVAGPGLESYRPIEREGIEIAPTEDWLPRVETVAKLGMHAYRAGLAKDAVNLLPNYVRASAAEEKAKQLGTKSG